MNLIAGVALLAITANAAVLQKQFPESEQAIVFGAGERSLEDSSSSSGGFLWFLCCIWCCIGIPVAICYYCGSCCFKGKGYKDRQGAPAAAPAPAAAAPVIVQIHNNNGSD